MALQTASVQPAANGFDQLLTVTGDTTPSNFSVYWKRTTETTYKKVTSYLSHTGTKTYEIFFNKLLDTIPPVPPMVDPGSLSYDNKNSYLYFDVILSDDTGADIELMIKDETANLTIDNLSTSITTGLQGYVFEVNSSINSSLTNESTPVYTTDQTSRKERIYDDGTLKYIHTASLDEANNLSEIATEIVDITPPTQDTDFFINDIKIGVNNQLMNFTSNKMEVTVTGATQPRGETIFRDIQLINVETQEVLAERTDLTSVNNLNIHVSPFNNPKISTATRLQLTSKTYNRLGATLGTASSRPFKINMETGKFSLSYTSNLPKFLDDSSKARTMSWKVSGDTAEVYKYRVEMRTRLNSSPSWGPWGLVDEVTSPTYTFSSPSTVGYTGYTVREFRVCGVTPNGNTYYYNHPEIMADLLLIVDPDPTVVGVYLRLPLGIHNLDHLSSDTKGTVKIGDTTLPQKSFTLTSTTAKGTIGNNSTTLLALALNPGEHMFSDNKPNIENISRDIQVGMTELRDEDPNFSSSTTTTQTIASDPASMDIYVILAYEPDVDKVISSSSFTQDPDVSIKKTASTSIVTTYNMGEGSITKTTTKTVAKYDDLPTPTLELAESYPDISDEPGLVKYDPPIEVLAKSSLSTSTYPVSITYTRLNGTTYETDTKTGTNLKLTKPGSYTIYASISYEDTNTTRVSDETMMVFAISEGEDLYFPPTFTHDPSSLAITINTNVPKTRAERDYTYTLRNTSTQQTVTTSDFSTSLNGGDLVYTYTPSSTFISTGINEVILEVRFKDRETHQYSILIFKDSAQAGDGSNLLGSPTYMNGDGTTDSSALSNTYFMAVSNHPSSYDLKNYIYRTSLNSKVLATVSRGSDNKFYIPENGTLNLDQYYVDLKNRNEVYDLSSITTGGRKLDGVSYNVSAVNPTTKPPVPVITITGPTNGLEDNLGESTYVFRKDPSKIQATLTNFNANLYRAYHYVDGSYLGQGATVSFTNSPLRYVGDHEYTCIYVSRKNYRVSYTTTDIEIVEPSGIYQAPFVEILPKDEKWSMGSYRVKIHWYASQTEQDRDTRNTTGEIYKDYTFIFNEGSSTETSKHNVLSSPSFYDSNKISIAKSTGYTEETIPSSIIEEFESKKSDLTVRARKTYKNGVVVESRYRLPLSDIVRDEPYKYPKINLVNGNKNPDNLLVYMPVIQRDPDWMYTLTLNGKPYKEGTPITNYEHNLSENNLTVQINDRYSDRSTTQSFTINLDTTPPEKPLIANLEDKGKAIYPVNDLTRISILKKESGVDYKLILNGKEIAEGASILSQPTKTLNGRHTLAVYARKRSNGLITYTSYSFYVNTDSQTTDKFHTKEPRYSDGPASGEVRPAIIPLSRSNDSFDTPGELVMDKSTGDISLVTRTRDPQGGYVIKDITRGLRNDLKGVEGELGTIFTANAFNEEEVDSLNEGRIFLDEIFAGNLRPRLTRLANKLATISTREQEQAQADVDRLITRTRTKLNNLTTKSEGLPSLTTTHREQTTLINTLRGDIIRYSEALSTAALTMYNLRSIELVALPKVTKTAFSSFKTRNNQMKDDITNKVRNFE